MSDDLGREVRLRAGNLCEYCLLPQSAFQRSFHIEHIVARQHGGRTMLDNLALACWYCNLKKGPNLSGLDPQTAQVVRLFNPREQAWAEHFRIVPLTAVSGSMMILGRTPSGRATLALLDMNREFRCELRRSLAREGSYIIPSA